MNEAKQRSEAYSQEYGNRQNSSHVGASSYDNQHKLTPAQIQNRKYSIFIKNLSILSDQKYSDETEAVKNLLWEILEPFGQVNTISVDGSRKSAIIRFK